MSPIDSDDVISLDDFFGSQGSPQVLLESPQMKGPKVGKTALKILKS